MLQAFKIRRKDFYILFVLTLPSFLLLSTPTYAQLKFGNYFTSYMVLQRANQIKIDGFGQPDADIHLQVSGKRYHTNVSADGRWIIMIDSLHSDVTYQLKLSSKGDSVVLNNVLVGDVWFCSGQSNMDWRLDYTDNKHLQYAEMPLTKIRLFSVSKRMQNFPESVVSGSGWQMCTVDNAKDFSAIGYYFGKEISAAEGIPIGLIESAWGGTTVETWMPSDAFKEGSRNAEKVQESAALDFDQYLKENSMKRKQWLIDLDLKDRGLSENWFKKTNFSDWKKMNVPGYWEKQGHEDLDGVFWFSTSLNLDIKQKGEGLLLSLGKIDDMDYLYVNGKLVDSTLRHDAHRKYNIRPEDLIVGSNKIVLRIKDTGGEGGFWGEADSLYWQVSNTKYALDKTWYYKLGTEELAKKPSWISPNTFPSLLFNAMVHPFTAYKIKGVLWYQGENNTYYPDNYGDHFKKMISAWRTYWKMPDLPFLYIQLPNYEANGDHMRHKWALLREQQEKALGLSSTAMAVTIDLADANNLHPRNKEEFAKRLVRLAKAQVYDYELQASGPQLMEADFNKNIVKLSFGNTSDLRKMGALNNFEIAGLNEVFYHVMPSAISENTITLTHETIKEIRWVRFAFSNNPAEFNFKNEEGLPAAPFRLKKE